MKKIFLSLSIIIGFVGMFNFTYAADPVNITLKVYSGDTVLFDGPKTITPCAQSPDIIDPLQFTVNGKCAIEQSGLSNTWTWNYTPSGWLDELGGYTTTPDYSKSWNYFVNLTYGHGSDALNQYNPSANDELLLTYDSYPLRISASQNSGAIGDTIIFTAEEESTFDANYNMIWTPLSEAMITLDAQSCVTITDGTCSIILNTSGSLNAVGSKTLHVPSANVNIEVSAPDPEPEPVQHNSSGSYVNYIPTTIANNITKSTFDLKKAFEFIISQQKENGSFGEDIYTDWTALALASGNYQDQTIKLIKYFGESKTENKLVTDYERHAMALMALGLNPYNMNGENYIEKITASFDGKQFGDINQDNDDIFSLIVLSTAGFTETEKMIIDDISFILSKQKENGSWDESVDMTGAAIQALANTTEKSCFLVGSLSAPAGAALPLGSPACETSKNKELFSAVNKAKEFLKQNQKDDGGWGNVSSTAWAMQGIIALSEKPEDWKKNDKTPFDYLASNQDADGGIKNEYLQNRIWETSYVITALSGKTWNQIMYKFNKPTQAQQEAKEKSSKQIIAKNITQKTKIADSKKEIQKTENLSPQNTATVINSLDEKSTEPIKDSWFRNFLNKIFSIF